MASQATTAGGEGLREQASDAWKGRGSSAGYGSDDSEALGSEDLSSSQHSTRDSRRHLISTWLPNGENVESALAAVAALNQNTSPHGFSGASAHIARGLVLLLISWQVERCLHSLTRSSFHQRVVELASTGARALFASLIRAYETPCLTWRRHARGSWLMGNARDGRRRATQAWRAPRAIAIAVRSVVPAPHPPPQPARRRRRRSHRLVATWRCPSSNVPTFGG